MRTATQPLKDLLHTSRTFYWAELYEFSFLDGSYQRYTSLDTDVEWGGNTYYSKGLLINRSALSLSRGIEVDDLELEIFPQPSAILGGVYFLRAAQLGALDGTKIILKRLFFSRWPNPVSGVSNAVGAITLFSGRVSDIEIGRTSINIAVKSDVELFNVPWPRHLYQPLCNWSLYDTGCRVSKSAFTASGTVSSGSTKSVIKSNISSSDGYYDLGTVRFTSGANIGSARTIKQFVASGGTITVIPPWQNIPVAGDTFSIYPGCDRTLTTCTNKFSNANQFRGFPFIPTPEAAL
jgi:uncharacterized phage protein (TIGR02218 family)